MNSPEIEHPQEVLSSFVKLASRVQERNGRLGIYVVRQPLRLGKMGVVSLIDIVRVPDNDLRKKITTGVSTGEVRQRLTNGIRMARYLGVITTKAENGTATKTVTLSGTEADMGPWVSVGVRYLEDNGRYLGVDTTVGSPDLSSPIRRSWGTRQRLMDTVDLNSTDPVGPEQGLYVPLRAVSEINGALADIARTYPLPPPLQQAHVSVVRN